MHATTEIIDGKPNAWQQHGARAKQRCARERLLDELEGRPRVWMEVLESRRMLSDGFGVNGWSTAKFAGHPGMAMPDALAEAPDGKIYAVGDVGDWNGEWALARFNADGTPDRTFGPDGTGTETFSPGVPGSADHIVIQKDGKFIVTGEHSSGITIARFNEDGTLDTSFGGGARLYTVLGGFTPWWIGSRCGVWLTGEGKVMVVAENGPDLVALRLTSSGVGDQTYAPGGVTRITIDPGDDAAGMDVALAAAPTRAGGLEAYVNVWQEPTEISQGNGDGELTLQLVRVELDADGNLVSRKVIDSPLAADPNMPGPGSVMFMGRDGSAYVTSNGEDPRVLKLDPSGNPDPTFGDHGLATAPGRFAQVQGVTSDGRVIVQCGNYNTIWFPGEYPTAVLAADGSVDQTFNNGQPFSGGVDTAAIGLADGSILIGYATGDYRAAPNFRLRKMLADGTQALSASGIDLSWLGAALDEAGQASGTPLTGDNLGLFDDASDATLWDPNGTQDVWDDGTGGA